MARAAEGGPRFEVRRSKVHGQGVFALRRIRKGTRLIEYLGERVSHAEADRRYEDKDERDNHTFLFTVDARTVIDAGVGGNEARFFNHSCDPNCESELDGKRVWIRAIRTILPGQEMTYDYQIVRDDDDPPNIDEIFACRCGAPNCRGTMLWPKPEPKARRTAAKAKKQSGLTQRAARPESVATRRSLPAAGKAAARTKRTRPESLIARRKAARR
jgi:hypothetical protein